MRKALTMLTALTALAALSACGADSEPGPDAASAGVTATELPDGTTATDGQAAFLEDVAPSLTGDHAKDVLAVLAEGESVCTVITDPSSDAGQATAIQFMSQSGVWSQTEATAIVRAAAEHLC